MSASTIIFYILAALVLLFGAMTVFSRKIFRSAVFLLFTLIGVAGIYFLMDMDFVAALQIVIYVGGIVVLIIFSIFLTHQSGEKLMKQSAKQMIGAAVLSIAGFAVVNYVFIHQSFIGSGKEALAPTVKNIGHQMLSYSDFGYAFPFEVVSVLLLAALIGSIVIAIKTKK
jgi:NADH-quinone oxidoreductase subunit J